jgi:hypothetical protein
VTATAGVALFTDDLDNNFVRVRLTPVEAHDAPRVARCFTKEHHHADRYHSHFVHYRGESLYVRIKTAIAALTHGLAI